MSLSGKHVLNLTRTRSMFPVVASVFLFLFCNEDDALGSVMVVSKSQYGRGAGQWAANQTFCCVSQDFLSVG